MFFNLMCIGLNLHKRVIVVAPLAVQQFAAPASGAIAKKNKIVFIRLPIRFEMWHAILRVTEAKLLELPNLV